ncbi:MAG: helix-turn-helix transcriptional regulator [Ilumatobacteraceae bacterium]
MGPGERRSRRVDPLERVLNLFTLLHRARAPMTREQIVAEMARGMTPYPTTEDAQRQLFASDKRTIVRDLGIRVRQDQAHGDDAGQTRYWIAEEDMAVPELDLTEDEMGALSLALAAIHNSVPEASEALMKLEGMLPRRIGFDFQVQVPLLVVRLTEMVQRGELLRLEFDGQRITVQPNRLLFDKGTWYLITYLRHEQRWAALPCARIALDFEIVEDPEADDGAGDSSALDPPQTIEDIRRLVHNARGEDLEATVIVDDHNAALPWLDHRVLDTEPIGEGRLRLTVRVDDPARFRGWLIGFGPHAAIESPAWLRRDVLEWLGDLKDVTTSIPPAPARPTEPPTRPGPRPLGERLQRLLSIIPWLRLHGSIPVADLAGILGIGPQQLMKDLEFASMCGVPPYTHDALFDFSVSDGMVLVHSPMSLFDGDSKNRKSRHLMTRSVKLTPRQATAVALALASLDAAAGERRIDDPAVSGLRAKLQTALGDLPIEVRLEDAPFLAEMRTVVEQARQIEVTYVNAEGEVSRRVLDPLQIFFERGEAYLIADDHVSGDSERTFRIDQIVDFEETGESVEPRAVAFRGWNFRGDITEALLFIAPGNDWVLDRVSTDAHVINADGSMFVWVTVASRQWLARLLARCGRPSRVVEPVVLNEVVRSWIESIEQQYAPHALDP